MAGGLKIASVTIVIAAAITWACQSLGPRSVWVARAVVWLPMIWLGIVSRFVRPRLSRRYHGLRSFERSGRCYELLGVRFAKRLLRRGPLAAFNPDLHLPSEPEAARIADLDQRMQDAEASHAILFALTIGLVVNAAVRGWAIAAGATLLFNVVLNGYPVMLQRYNRVLLVRRYPQPGWDPDASRGFELSLAAFGAGVALRRHEFPTSGQWGHRDEGPAAAGRARRSVVQVRRVRRRP